MDEAWFAAEAIITNHNVNDPNNAIVNAIMEAIREGEQRVHDAAAARVAALEARVERLREAAVYAEQSAAEEVDAITGGTSPWARGYRDAMIAAVAIMEGARDDSESDANPSPAGA